MSRRRRAGGGARRETRGGGRAPRGGGGGSRGERGARKFGSLLACLAHVGAAVLDGHHLAGLLLLLPQEELLRVRAHLRRVARAHVLRDRLDVLPAVSLHGLDEELVLLGSPVPRLARAVLLVGRAVALERAELRAQPLDLRPRALQLVLQLNDAPLLLNEQRAAQRELELELGLRGERDGPRLEALVRVVRGERLAGLHHVPEERETVGGMRATAKTR